MTTNRYLGGFRSTPFTFGDTYEPDEAHGAGSMEKMEKKTGRFSEIPANISAAISRRGLLLLGAR